MPRTLSPGIGFILAGFLILTAVLSLRSFSPEFSTLTGLGPVSSSSSTDPWDYGTHVSMDCPTKEHCAYAYISPAAFPDTEFTGPTDLPPIGNYINLVQCRNETCTEKAEQTIGYELRDPFVQNPDAKRILKVSCRPNTESLNLPPNWQCFVLYANSAEKQVHLFDCGPSLNGPSANCRQTDGKGSTYSLPGFPQFADMDCSHSTLNGDGFICPIVMHLDSIPSILAQQQSIETQDVIMMLPYEEGNFIPPNTTGMWTNGKQPRISCPDKNSCSITYQSQRGAKQYIGCNSKYCPLSTAYHNSFAGEDFGPISCPTADSCRIVNYGPSTHSFMRCPNHACATITNRVMSSLREWRDQHADISCTDGKRCSMLNDKTLFFHCTDVDCTTFEHSSLYALNFEKDFSLSCPLGDLCNIAYSDKKTTEVRFHHCLSELCTAEESSSQGSQGSRASSGASQGSVGPGCHRTGCNDSVCTEEGIDIVPPPSCVEDPEVQGCYDIGVCEKQEDDECGWSNQNEINACLSGEQCEDLVPDPGCSYSCTNPQCPTEATCTQHCSSFGYSFSSLSSQAESSSPSAVSSSEVSSSAGSSVASSANPSSSSRPSSSAPFNPAGCGNGIREGSEQCDDGNTVDLDACTNACRVPRCGDTKVQTNEACDDGNTVNNDACTNDCKRPGCGDGLKQSNEECDDGNTVSGDGCSIACSLETNASSTASVRGQSQQSQQSQSNTGGMSSQTIMTQYTSSQPATNASSTGGVQQAFCGNGSLETGEVCDQGSQNANTPDALCRTDCSLARCGDGVRDSVEACDDGNRLNGDGCSDLCSVSGTTTQALPATLTEFPESNGATARYGVVTLANGNEIRVQRTVVGTWVDSRGLLVADAAGRVLIDEQGQSLANGTPLLDAQGNVMTDTQGRILASLVTSDPLYGGAYQPPEQTAGTGPEVLGVMAAGAAAGYAWMRRRRA